MVVTFEHYKTLSNSLLANCKIFPIETLRHRDRHYGGKSWHFEAALLPLQKINGRGKTSKTSSTASSCNLVVCYSCGVAVSSRSLHLVHHPQILFLLFTKSKCFQQLIPMHAFHLLLILKDIELKLI